MPSIDFRGFSLTHGPIHGPVSGSNKRIAYNLRMAERYLLGLLAVRNVAFLQLIADFRQLRYNPQPMKFDANETPMEHPVKIRH